MKKDGDDLSPQVRAEDIILGSLGFGEEARVVSIERTAEGYKGIGRWADGEQFPFESEDEIDELTEWALQILLESKGSSQEAVNR
ncbi:MAG: hypothetical protein RL518_2710 [Pseudomonadota bacterium]|jgi:hypothetical protein